MSVTIVALLYFSILFGATVLVLHSVAHVAVDSDLVFSAVFIARIQFAYNFFIYVIFNDIYRENVKIILTKLCCRFCCCRDRNEEDIGSLDVTGLYQLRSASTS